MIRVALYGRVLTEEIRKTAELLIDELLAKGASVCLHARLKEINTKGLPICKTPEEIRQQAEVLISLGGDGTILDTVTLVRDSEIPVLGINLGRLGFLSSRPADDLEKTVDLLENRNFEIDRRSLLMVDGKPSIYDGSNFGLNEFTIQRKDTSSMITVRTKLNGELLSHYWADGLIVATATGSTGYSLSCGGPIIYPSSKSMIITPVAPHNLNVRPIVVPDDSVLSLRAEGRGDQFMCTLDSRVEEISSAHEITVRKAPFDFCLLRMDDSTFLNAIREKLLWGADRRN